MNSNCSRLLSCFILLQFLLPGIASAQKNYTAIDKFAKHAPPGVSTLYKPLTHYLTDRYSSDDEKVRSISTWIIHNIKYDTKVVRTDNRKKLSPDKILLRRKAICQGYCDLFEAMCIEAGIDARTVSGYDKGGNYQQDDIFVRDDHAWSAVNIEGGWQLLDLTWAAGYVQPRKQTFRRLLYYFFSIRFRQKYKFIKHPDYHYYFTPPDTFALDHLPKYPWWQLKPEQSIAAFEKDTTVRKLKDTIRYALPAPGAIPSLERDQAPVSHLKRAEVAFTFNDKNYRALGEGKTLYAYDWFKQTKKSKELGNKEKVKVYDSCKVVVDEAKDAIRMYMKYTGKEREVRFIKNNGFTKFSREFSKGQKRLIAAETRQNYAIINKIEQQIEALKAENRNLRSEQSYISGYKLPERKKRATATISKEDYRNSCLAARDSVQQLTNDLQALLTKNEEENFGDINSNNKHIDSLISLSCSYIYRKIIERIFFDWHTKITVDTLQYRHFAIANEKDSVIRLQELQLKKVAHNEDLQATRSADIRNHYRRQLKSGYALYASVKDSILDAYFIQDSCTEIKTAWREYNNKRMHRNDEEIRRLKNKKRSLHMINRYLRVERRYDNYELYFEGKRYSYYNWRYSRFFSREKKKAARYYKNLVTLKKVIQQEDTKCKEKVREEEHKEKEKE